MLAPTDSRFRPDQRTHEHGDTKTADIEKKEVEQLQRDRRKREAANKITYKPLYFKSKEIQDLITKKQITEWDEIEGENSYWERRER